MKTLKMKQYEYLDLKISDTQLIEFDLIYTNNQMKLLILSLLEHSNQLYKKVYLSNIINYQCKIIHINKTLQKNLLNSFILDLYFYQVPRTTDCLYNIYNKDILVKLIFDSFKHLNNIKNINNPNSLYNLSMNKYINYCFEFSFEKQKEILKNLKIPNQFKLKIYNHIITNSNILKSISKNIECISNNKNKIEQSNNIFVNDIIKTYTNYYY